MISQEAFYDGMGLLMVHFEKQLDPVVLGIWKEELDQHLSDEEFAEAGRQLILFFEQRFKGHFPTAKHILDVINGSREAKALQDWQKVLTAASCGDEEQLFYISHRGRVALQAIGGLKTVGMAEDYKRTHLEKSFVTVYCQCADKDAHSLPPSISKTPVRNNSGLISAPEHQERPREPVDLSTKPKPIRRVLENLEMRSMGQEIPVEQVYRNTFTRHGWEIDDNRLNHLLALNQEQIRDVLNKFSFAIKNSQWRSLMNIFDEITGYQPIGKSIDAKEIARQWLEENRN
jgi:hypothetical protein